MRPSKNGKGNRLPLFTARITTPINLIAYYTTPGNGFQVRFKLNRVPQAGRTMAAIILSRGGHRPPCLLRGPRSSREPHQNDEPLGLLGSLASLTTSKNCRRLSKTHRNPIRLIVTPARAGTRQLAAQRRVRNDFEIAQEPSKCITTCSKRFETI